MHFILQPVTPHTDGSPRFVWTPVFTEEGIARIIELLGNVPPHIKNPEAHKQLQRNERRRGRKDGGDGGPQAA